LVAGRQDVDVGKVTAEHGRQCFAVFVGKDKATNSMPTGFNG